MPCFRKCDCAKVVYTVYREEGERIGNIPCQVGKGGKEEKKKNKMVRESRKKWVGNKKKRSKERGKSQERRSEKCTGDGEALGPDRGSGRPGGTAGRRRGEGRPSRSPTSPANLGPAPSPEGRARVQRPPPAPALPPPGGPQGGAGPWWGGPQGRAPVPDCWGALGQAFQLAGPDLSGGLSSREINRGGGLQ